MSRIYFNKGEKDRFNTFIKHSIFNISLVKKTNMYNEVLLLYTPIAESLIDTIVEYTHELINIHCIKNVDSLNIELTNQFKIFIKLYESPTYITLSAKNMCHVYIRHPNSLFDYNAVRVSEKVTNPKEIIDSKSYCKYNMYLLDYFMNYYMHKYYNKDKYIKNIDCTDDLRHGIYNNTFYQEDHTKREYTEYNIMRMLDHRKIKQMIIIVKLFVDLFSKE